MKKKKSQFHSDNFELLARALDNRDERERKIVIVEDKERNTGGRLFE